MSNAQPIPVIESCHWFVLHSGPCSPFFNMALDEALLEAMPKIGAPVLRFYGWTEPAASFGYFQKYKTVAALTLLRPLVRRPTAGGLVPHDADWTYSVVFPNHHPWYAFTAVDSYRQVHEWIQRAMGQLEVTTALAAEAQKSAPGQCFSGYERFDLLWHGRKIAGAAQRRTRDGLLIQGSVQPPPIGLGRTEWEQAMQAVALPLTPPSPHRMGRGGRGNPAQDPNGLRNAQWSEFTPEAAFNERVQALVRQKYSLDSYNQKR